MSQGGLELRRGLVTSVEEITNDSSIDTTSVNVSVLPSSLGDTTKLLKSLQPQYDSAILSNHHHRIVSVKFNLLMGPKDWSANTAEIELITEKDV